jgi:hypothetical protein
MPEFIGVRRQRARARRELKQKLHAAAAGAKRTPHPGPAETYHPGVEGRLDNDDKIVEKQQARKLQKRRAFIRRGHIGRFRARILGMRLLTDRVERTGNHLDACTADHELIDSECGDWKKEMGVSAFVPVVPRPVVLALATVGAAAETMFSSGAAEVLVGTTGAVPDWAELPLSLLLAGLFGLGTLLLTKWGVEEAMLIQFFKGRRIEDRLRDAPWAGRSPFGRVVRVVVAAGAVALVIIFSAHLRGDAANIKAAATPQPVSGAKTLGAGGAEIAPPVAGISDSEFLALGIGTALLMAAFTLIAMDPYRIHGKRLSTAERWAKRRVGFWRWRKDVAVRLLEITKDRDMAAVAKADLVKTGQQVTTSQLLIDIADEHPELYGNAWPDPSRAGASKDLGLSPNGRAHIPEPKDRYGDPALDLNGSGGDA